MSSPSTSRYYKDNWPRNADNNLEWDGKDLWILHAKGLSPFRNDWDLSLLICEVEENLKTSIVDIPYIGKGSNSYGFHLKTAEGRDLIGRLSCGDVNVPNFDGFPFDMQCQDVQFEVDAYSLLQSKPAVLASHLLYHRLPVLHPEPRTKHPADIQGRRLLLFEKSPGKTNVWDELNDVQQHHLLTQAASMRAALFNLQLPDNFTAKWLLSRLFEQKPKKLPNPAFTRDFTLELVRSKIEATIKNIGDMIGWEDDHEVVGPVAYAAKQSLLRLLPYIVPRLKNLEEEEAIYRLVLDHGDWGIHNMTITPAGDITSVFDWDVGSITPALLSDPLMAILVDLVTDGNGAPTIIRTHPTHTEAEQKYFQKCSEHYFKVLFAKAPSYHHAIILGKDLRHLWFALRDWRGENPEGYFGELGIWAEEKYRMFSV
ncbi:hypothetical protein GYMLUDRAFT_73533 [Collybiopsis luxurians FD-317 M1]|uniref:Aminoglycoside phosphotransferase domain-containing protein n=1 Tax=Collybiopsis luxurians FD-317 M1 TaxID=944289 RepID=A0A0D0BZ43_9AGAR|nr:hypothetical protein GYMLUDRAFT_73533 [Collybiopsis luxurians FD-317 M1]